MGKIVEMCVKQMLRWYLIPSYEIFKINSGKIQKILHNSLITSHSPVNKHTGTSWTITGIHTQDRLYSYLKDNFVY